MLRGFLVALRFEVEYRLSEPALRFANFFIKAEKGRRRPDRPGWSVLVSAAWSPWECAC